MTVILERLLYIFSGTLKLTQKDHCLLFSKTQVYLYYFYFLLYTF